MINYLPLNSQSEMAITPEKKVICPATAKPESLCRLNESSSLTSQAAKMNVECKPFRH